MFEKDTLSSNLQKDFNFEGDGVLHIIDDYHVKNLSDGQCEFYINEFRKVDGLNTIIIYYQIKEHKKAENAEQAKYILENISQKVNIKEEELFSFFVLALKPLTISNVKEFDENIISCTKIDYKYRKAFEKNIQAVIKFIEAFEKINIKVAFQPYSALDFNPPFHGRYWLNSLCGWIVDASLNTYDNGMIFAQKMDPINYNIISDLLTRIITCNSRDYGEISIDEIKAIYKTIYRHE